MSDLLLDLRFAARSLRRDPAFTAVAALTLALGIGVNTAIFSVVDAVLLRPLPFADQERLAVIWESQIRRDYATVEVSYPNFRDWRNESRHFAGMAALTSTNLGMSLTGGDEPLDVAVAAVTHDFFAVLGVEAALGRTFTAAEDRPGEGRVAVLSDGLWRRSFGGDPQLVGSAISLDGDPYTVVGVMPPGLVYPPAAELWVPLVPTMGATAEERVYRILKAVGRLAPDGTFDGAQAELSAIAARLGDEFPDSNDGFGAAVRPLTEELFGGVDIALTMLLAAAGLVLAIASVNVANLLLARTTARRQEIAARAALGAGRARLLRQLLTEGAVLALVAAGAGVLLAAGGVRLLAALGPPDVPRLDEVRIDGTALAFALGAALITLALFAAAPALSACRLAPTAALNEGSRGAGGGRRGGRLRSWLAVAEVALAVVVLTAAGLLAQSFRQLQRLDLGYRPAGVLSLRVRLPENKYPEIHGREAFFDRLLERLQALPGVEAAAGVLLRPLEDTIGWDVPFAVEGQSSDELFTNPYSNFQVVTPDYFRTLDIPLLAGRTFTADDREETARVAIVGRSFARRFWPGQEAVGKRLRRVIGSEQTPWMTVVGVVEDVHYRSLETTGLDLYLPVEQNPFKEYINYRDFVLRTRGDPLSLAAAARREVYALDPGQAVADLTTLERLVDERLARPRFTLLLMGAFGLLALALATVGIYGVLSYSVRQRAGEIGIRKALGADDGKILGMVLSQGMRLALVGLVLGLLGAMVASRALSRLLFEVDALDPATYLLVALVLGSIALAAIYLPARRATRGDPVASLRAE